VVLLLLPNRSILRLVPLISMPMSSFMISYDIHTMLSNLKSHHSKPNI